MSRLWIWFMVAVAALTAERRTVNTARMASTWSADVFGVGSLSLANAAAAAA